MVVTPMEKETSKQRRFAEAYKKYADPLLRFSFFKLNDRELSKDIIQDAFVKVWQYMAQRPVKNIRALLYKMTSNLVIDEYRRRKPVDSLDDLNEKGFDPGFNDTEEMMHAIDAHEAQKLMKQVPQPYRKTLFLKFFKGLSLNEISNITHEKKNVIAVHIHRGIAKLRKLYKGGHL